MLASDEVGGMITEGTPPDEGALVTTGSLASSVAEVGKTISEGRPVEEPTPDCAD